MHAQSQQKIHISVKFSGKTPYFKRFFVKNEEKPTKRRARVKA
jgi:hypothetical protein